MQCQPSLVFPELVLDDERRVRLRLLEHHPTAWCVCTPWLELQCYRTAVARMAR